MYAPRFNMDLINFLRELLETIDDQASLQNKRDEFARKIQAIEKEELLLIIYELAYSHYGFTRKDIDLFFELYEESFSTSLYKIEEKFDAWHPVTIFRRENQLLKESLEQLRDLLGLISPDQEKLTDEKLIHQLRDKLYRLGEFINHYNRKEKLIFPLLERHGQFSMTRLMWAEDDRIRNLYRGIKGMADRLESLHFIYFQQSFTHFYQAFRDMLHQEETFLLPVLHSFFTEEDWLSIYRESDAYGYSLIDPAEEILDRPPSSWEIDPSLAEQQIPFAAGFLSLKEANAILNNLPVEITFVDKFGVFKYFNDMVQASEMMFVRTPSSIGRNVGNCHPPKSMKKVARLIRELQLKKREFECMWFKKDGKYIHITYKGLFDQDGEYLGILEYVQDIKPFLNLPKETKKELSPLK